MCLLKKLAATTTSLILLTCQSSYAEKIDLGTHEEVEIQVTRIGDPMNIEFDVPPMFKDENVSFSEDWPFDITRNERLQQTWAIGYSTNIGPYIHWVEGDKYTQLENWSIFPLDILIHEGEGCSASNAEMKECKRRILELWQIEYEGALQKLNENERFDLSASIELYKEQYEKDLFESYEKAQGSHATNEWIWKQINFFKYQINLINGVINF